MLGKKIVIHGSTHSFWDHASGRVQRLSGRRHLDALLGVFNGARSLLKASCKTYSAAITRTRDAQSLLHDVLVFIDTCEDAKASQTPLDNDGERDKKRRVRNYSPTTSAVDARRRRWRERPLRSQVAQYEMQVELLRTQRLIHRDDSKEEEKRRKAEKLNHQLRGLLVQQFNVAQTLRNVLTQETGFAQVRHIWLVLLFLSHRIECVLCSSAVGLKWLSTVFSTDDVKHVPYSKFNRNASERDVGCLRDSAEHVFESASIFDANSLGALVCSANLKYQDPISGRVSSCLARRPTKQQTQSSVEIGYSVNFNGPDASGAVDGVTLMEKFDEDATLFSCGRR
ncbi:hypothetical protein GQ600_9074 [Phytophthora cactorum]|nr:hypothetical protein GQ600_9074 [Phytophthora cactorum]